MLAITLKNHLNRSLMSKCMLLNSQNLSLNVMNLMYNSKRFLLKGTMSPPKKEEIKFSAFLREEKTYTIEPKITSDLKHEPYIPKPEVNY